MPFCIPVATYESSSCSTSLPVFFNRSNRYVMIYLTVVLIYLSPIINNAEQLLMCLFVICMYCLVKYLQNFAHILIRLLVFLLFSYKNFLYILSTSVCRYVFCKYFLPVCGLSFHSLNSVFCTANIFNIDEVPIYQLVFFYGLCFWCHT